MGEREPFPLGNLPDRIAFGRDLVDLASSDPELIPLKVQHLTYVAYYVNAIAVTEFGGKSGGVRAEGLVEQVVGAAFQTFGDFDPHPDPFDKAAMLLRGITQGHPFADGNKRTGFMVAYYWLEHLRFRLPAEQGRREIIDFCVQVSAGDIRDVGEMADRLRRFWGQPRQ